MKMVFKKTAITVGNLLVLMPLFAEAQIAPWGGGIPLVTPNAQFDILKFVTQVLSWAFGLLIVIAVLFIVYAAFLYITAAGEDDKIKQAKNYIVYAVIALVVGAISQALIAIVRNFLQT